MYVVIGETERAFTGGSQTLAFDIPCREDTASYGPEPKEVKVFTKTGACRVFRCCDPTVMASIVFHVKMTVCDLRQNDFCQPALDDRLLVTKLMGHVDCCATQ